MSISPRLIHRCWIQRATEAQDAAGSEVQTFADCLVNEPCRLVVKAETVASPLGLLTAVTYKLLLKPGLDVRASDQVSKVILDDQSQQGPFAIEAVLPRLGQRGQHHLTVLLRMVQQASAEQELAEA